MNTDTTMNTSAVESAPVLNLEANLTAAEIEGFREFTKDNSGAVGENLAKAIIAKVGGWRKFVYLAPEVLNFGIEHGFDGLKSFSDIYAMFFENKAGLMAFGNELSWDYDCDNVYDLTEKLVSDQPYGDERIAAVYDEVKQGEDIADTECFTDVSKWIVWNAAQYLFDNYIVYSKWVADGRPDEVLIPDEVKADMTAKG